MRSSPYSPVFKDDWLAYVLDFPCEMAISVIDWRPAICMLTKKVTVSSQLLNYMTFFWFWFTNMYVFLYFCTEEIYKYI